MAIKNVIAASRRDKNSGKKDGALIFKILINLLYINYLKNTAFLIILTKISYNFQRLPKKVKITLRNNECKVTFT